MQSADNKDIFLLKEKVEIDREPAAAMAEEVAVGRVGDVVVDDLGVEMVGQVEPRKGEADSVLGIDLNVLREAGIDGEEGGESGLVGNSNILARRVNRSVGETAPIFNDRSDAEARGEA